MRIQNVLTVSSFVLVSSLALPAGAQGVLVSTAKSVKNQPHVEIEASVKPKSFREWKNERVSSSQAKVDSLKTKIEQMKSSGTSTKDPAMDKAKQQLDQAQFTLDLAQELSVTDYFVGYLTKMEDRKSAISAVAGKLAPDEVAELMNAYANSVFGTVNEAGTKTETGRVGDLTK